MLFRCFSGLALYVVVCSRAWWEAAGELGDALLVHEPQPEGQVQEGLELRLVADGERRIWQSLSDVGIAAQHAGHALQNAIVNRLLGLLFASEGTFHIHGIFFLTFKSPFLF